MPASKRRRGAQSFPPARSLHCPTLREVDDARHACLLGSPLCALLAAAGREVFRASLRRASARGAFSPKVTAVLPRAEMAWLGALGMLKSSPLLAPQHAEPTWPISRLWRVLVFKMDLRVLEQCYVTSVTSGSENRGQTGGGSPPLSPCRINTKSKRQASPCRGGGGGGERLIKDLKRKANSLSRGTRQASALGLEGRSPPHEGGGGGGGGEKFNHRS